MCVSNMNIMRGDEKNVWRKVIGMGVEEYRGKEDQRKGGWLAVNKISLVRELTIEWWIIKENERI